MLPRQMAELAVEAILDGGRMTMVLPQKVRWPKGFPRGTLLSETELRGRVYSFDPLKILAFIQQAHREDQERTP